MLLISLFFCDMGDSFYFREIDLQTSSIYYNFLRQKFYSYQNLSVFTNNKVFLIVEGK